MSLSRVEAEGLFLTAMGDLDLHKSEAIQMVDIFTFDPSSRPEVGLSDLGAIAEILFEVNELEAAANRAVLAFDMATQTPSEIYH